MILTMWPEDFYPPPDDAIQTSLHASHATAGHIWAGQEYRFDIKTKVSDAIRHDELLSVKYPGIILRMYIVFGCMRSEKKVLAGNFQDTNS